MSEDLPTPPEKVGPYRIESRLGIGGMGAVYRAYDQRLERPVAIKQVLPESADDPKARDRLRREARAVASLNHPSIVQIFDIVERDDGDWIVMELVEGQTLHRLIERGRLELGQALFLGREIAEGLAEAHSKGVVHRDLKTENVMVTLSGHAKILDFGLAKRLWKGRGEASISVQGSILGTGRAMSPEQAMGDPIDHRSDLFSLGTLLYETVTGKPPFMGSSIFHTLAQVCSDRQAPANEANPQVPTELSQLIDRMLEKNPARRPASAGEVADSLAQIAGRLPSEQGGVYLPSRNSSPSPTVTTDTSGSETLDREISPSRRVSAIGVRPEPPSTPQTPTHRTVTRMDSSSGIFIKTLLHLELAGRSRMSRRYSESRVYEALGRHDRMVRDLLVGCDGLEIDKTEEGFLLLFERPLDAVQYALEYERRRDQLVADIGIEMASRVGIHLGELMLRENTRQDVTRGAKPLEVEGASKRLVMELSRLARPGQILLSQEAYELARRALPEEGFEPGPVEWKSHGSVVLEGVGSVSVQQVGLEGSDFGTLDSPTVVLPATTSRAGVPRWAWLGAAVLVALLLVGLRGGWLSTPSAPVDPPRLGEDPADRTTVAVLGFRNQTGDPRVDWLSTAFAEMLRTELGAGGDLRMISGEGVAELEREIDIPATDSLSESTLGRIRNYLGNDLVVLGTFTSLGDGERRNLRVDVTLQDAATGNTVTRLNELDQESAVFEMVSSLGHELRRVLSVDQLTTAEVAEVRAATASPETYRLYAQGLERLRSFDALGAKDLLEQAVVAEPDFALAHAALSRAWLELGYDHEAAESARRAFDSVVDLPREHQLQIKARYRVVSGDWDDAIATYAELLEEFPSIEHGLGLANAQVTAGQRQAAVATLAGLRDSDVSQGDLPRLDLIESKAAYSGLDYAAAIQAAERAERQGRDLGATLLVAEALRQKGTALTQLGRAADADEALEEARQQLEEVGDRNSLADVTDSLALVRIVRGEIDAAERLHREALGIFEEIGNRKAVATVQNNLAVLYQGRGDLSRARQLADGAYAGVQDLGDRTLEARYLDTLAWISLHQGELGDARRFAEAEMAAYEALESPEGRAWALFYLGQVALLEGDLEAARDRHRQALELAPASDHYLGGFTSHGMAEVELEAADLEAAVGYLDEALRHRRAHSEKAALAETLYLRARYDFDRGDLEAADVGAREAARQLNEVQGADEENLAWGLVAEVLLAQGRPDEARRLLAPHLETTQNSQNPASRLEVQLVAARLDAAAGDPTTALEALESIRREAEALGMGRFAIEAQLTAATIEVSLDRPGAEERLARLVGEAEAKGLLRLARRAETRTSGSASGEG